MTLFLYALYSFVFSFLIQLVIIIICEIKNKRKQKCVGRIIYLGKTGIRIYR